MKEGIQAMLKSEPGETGLEWIVFDLHGRFDTTTAPKIRNSSLKMALKKEVHQLEMNFSEIVCADSSSVAVMLEVFRAIRAKGGRVRFTGIDPNTQRMISLSGLDELFSSIVIPEGK